MDKMALTFVSTYSIAEFKERFDVSVIEIIKNPNTSKLFFSCNSKQGNITGAVGNDYQSNPAISQVKGDNGEEFWLIHKRGNAENTVDTL